MSLEVEIQNRTIGSGRPVLIVAEMSANHQQKWDRAVQILKAAKEAGADAVKIQTYTADTLTLKSSRDEFKIRGGTLWDGKTLHHLFEEAYTPWEWHPKLAKIAGELGLIFFSTAFDPTAVDYLEEMNVPVHKVASFELVDLPLIEKMARTGKPLIMSTGMAAWEEIDEAVHTAQNAGAKDIILLKCTSAYPAPPKSMNLRAILKMRERYGVPVGLSDHTLGTTVPVAAVAYGACVIEKHFTVSRSWKGPDSEFSLEPAEFKAMVEAVRIAEQAVVGEDCGPTPDEEKSKIFRRSLFVTQDIKAGEILTERHIRSIRPAHGLAPKYMTRVLGRRVKEDLERGTPLTWNVLE